MSSTAELAAVGAVERVLAATDAVLADAVLVDLDTCTGHDLYRLSIQWGKTLDRLKAVHALAVHAADRRQVWFGSGARNVTDWLTTQTNTSYADAVSTVKLGDTMDASDTVTDAVLAGEMSTATATTLRDAVMAPPPGADVDALVETVKGAGPRDAKDAVQTWQQTHAPKLSDAEIIDRIRRRRSVRAGVPVDGIVTTTVELPVLEHRIFWNALSHITGEPCESDDRTPQQRHADALVALCDAYGRGEVTGGRERPRILITVDVDTYLGDADHDGTTSMGDRIPAAVVRHLADRAELQRVMLAGSHVLDLGRSVRLASEHQWAALVARDGGCRWPGCQIPAAWCEVDHLIPYPEGPSDLINEDLLCGHHHHVKHRPGTTIEGDGNDFTIILPDGTRVHCPTKRAAAPPGRPRPGPDPPTPDGTTTAGPATLQPSCPPEQALLPEQADLFAVVGS